MQEIIEAGWEDRSLLMETKTQETIKEVIELLDKGELRVAEPLNEEWKVNEWIKKAYFIFSYSKNENYRNWATRVS